MTKYIRIFIILLPLSACGQKETEKETKEGINQKFVESEKPSEPQKEEKWTDLNGDIFVENGNENSIIPAKYNKTGKTYKIFNYNETSSAIGIVENLKMSPNEFRVFNLKETDTLKLDNGVKFMFGDTYGLGGNFLDKYKVPTDAEWAFVVVPEGKGD
ncbi:MAG: hypothetical protein Aureis2KO_08360 [Aureisphaera sp.]